MFALSGIAIVVFGILLRANPLLVVAAAGLVTGLPPAPIVRVVRVQSPARQLLLLGNTLLMYVLVFHFGEHHE